MSRRGFSNAQKQVAAKQGALIQIYRGDQPPLYRVRMAPDGRYVVDWCPWLSIEASNRSEALAAARNAIAAWLEVEPDRFEVTAD